MAYLITDMPPSPAEIFDPVAKALALRRARARQAKTGVSFLLQRSADDAASRLADINRSFDRVLLVGPFDVREAVRAALPKNRMPANFEYATELAQGESYDAIISLLDLQSDDALPETLSKLRAGLSPDGLLLAALFGGSTLSELRQSLYGADQALLGGVSARVFPMVDYSQSAALLGHAGLALPVVDSDRFTVHYSGLERLVEDLRDLGLSNFLTARTRRSLPKNYLPKLQEIYAENFARADGKLAASFEILWLTGWAPHESQQKPLKPGSAKMRLADALGSRETKL